MSKPPTRDQVQLEYKAVPSFTKQIEGRSVTGIAAVMGNMDEGNDVGHMGMFLKTISDRKERVRHLWQHDAWSPPTAAITNLREIGEADLPEAVKVQYPSAVGALEVTREYFDSPRADEIFSAIKAGAITEMSYGFDIVKYDVEEIETDNGTKRIRHLREVRLWDTSDVNWGMNPATVASKGLPVHLLDLAALSRAWIDTQDALKNDNRVIGAAHIEQLKRLIDQMQELLTAEPPAGADTLRARSLRATGSPCGRARRASARSRKGRWGVVSRRFA